MMYHPVPEGGSAYRPCLWVSHDKSSKWSWRIGKIQQLAVQLEEIAFQLFLELYAVILKCFAISRLPEGELTIFKGAEPGI